MYMNVPKQLCRNYDCTLNSNEISQLQYEVKLIMTSVLLFVQEMFMIMPNKIFEQKIHL